VPRLSPASLRCRHRRAERALAPGVILLLHDADGWAPGRPRPQTVAALPEILRSLDARDLAPVRLDELVRVRWR
jgi:peptidoglycan-N-acetylglucosamine deacetylase